jgi:hypothetical protein
VRRFFLLRASLTFSDPRFREAHESSSLGRSVDKISCTLSLQAYLLAFVLMMKTTVTQSTPLSMLLHE